MVQALGIAALVLQNRNVRIQNPLLQDAPQGFQRHVTTLSRLTHVKQTYIALIYMYLASTFA